MLNGNIAGTYNAKKDFFEIQDPDWEFIGGGVWAIDEENKTLTLGGESKMYGKYNGSELKKKVSSFQAIAPINTN